MSDIDMTVEEAMEFISEQIRKRLEVPFKPTTIREIQSILDHECPGAKVRRDESDPSCVVISMPVKARSITLDMEIPEIDE